jgi:DNA-binding beta-propeller fold protein YncE
MVDLTTTPPSVVATAQAGLGAAGVSINREGTLALVANRNEGTVSVFALQGHTLTALDKIALGDAKSGPSHVMFTPDGKTALVTRDGDHRISMLAIEGTKVKATGRDMFAGQRPYGLDISARGDVAVVGNIGQGQGDADTVSLIDLTLTPPRVVDTVTVGATPEGIALSADGHYVGVAVINGSNKPKASPFFDEHGKFVLLRIDNKRLVPVTDAPVGAWPQGVAFSNDGRRVLVQSAMRKEIQVLAIDKEKITDTGIRLPMDGAPSSIRAIR